jgi:hypothetical protein
MSAVRRRRVEALGRLGAVAAPIALVAIAISAMDRQPRRASASQTVMAEFSAVPAAEARPTEAQERALAWLRERRPGPVGTPFAVPRSEPAPAPAPAPGPEPEPEPEPERLPTFVLGSVAGQGDRGAAMIDGRLRRLGDETAPGWRVVDIDGRAGRVVIEGPGGRRVELLSTRR